MCKKWYVILRIKRFYLQLRNLCHVCLEQEVLVVSGEKMKNNNDNNDKDQSKTPILYLSPLSPLMTSVSFAMFLLSASILAYLAFFIRITLARFSMRRWESTRRSTMPDLGREKKNKNRLCISLVGIDKVYSETGNVKTINSYFLFHAVAITATPTATKRQQQHNPKNQQQKVKTTTLYPRRHSLCPHLCGDLLPEHLEIRPLADLVDPLLPQAGHLTVQLRYLVL